MIYSENIFVCIVIPLLLSLLFVRKEGIRFVLGLIVGMLVCLLSAYISAYLGAVTETENEHIAVYVSPIVEEIMKILPVLFVLFIFDPPSDQVFLFAVAVGVGFATFENCCYLLSVGSQSISYMLIRGLAAGVMHIVSILFATIGLMQMRAFKAMSLPAATGAVILSITYHALYNLLVSVPGIPSVIGYLLPGLTALALFLVNRRLSIRIKS